MEIFSRPKNRPSNLTKANIWEEKQERACAAVKTRLSSSIERSVEKIENIDKLLEKIKTLLKPNANIAIQSAWDKFNDLSLEDCDGVLDLADQIRKFEADLDQFEIGIPKVLLITKFCKALGAEYSQFLLNHFSGRVLAKLDEGDTTQVADFDDLVFQTEAEERRQQGLGSQTTALVSTISSQNKRWNEMNIVNINGDESTVKVPWCTHCKRPYHNKDNCFVLHPEKKQRSDRYRGKRQRRDTHQTDTNHPAQPIVLMATTGLLEHLKDRFILVSACTQHLSPRRSDFVTFTDVDVDIAGIGDTPIKATGKGNLRIF